ncbi:WD40-repeat-containing domain protein [Xylaria scruposa]|nr:WD40-repeat-containing domain protein [Xylaria scruposa]
MKRLKERLGSLKNRVTKERNGDSSVVTSRVSLGVSHIDSSKSSTSDTIERHVPPSDEPPKTAVASPPETTLSVSPALITPTHPGSEGQQLGINNKDQQGSKHSTSQKLWNAAYDDLEKNEETADLVKSYIKILNNALSAETSKTPAPECDSVELRDPADRQEYMRKLVEEGQKRFATTSKITGGLQNVIGYIEKIKGVIDVAIGNIPQAALPWAGVSIGLQILSNPGKAVKSNLQGIVYVISRMDWYCALSECLLDEDKLVKSFEPILKQLSKAVTILYKTLLLYQIKSACYYHQHRSLTVLRGLASWDDWDGDLQEIKEAEQNVIEMSTLYHKEHGKKRLDHLYESAICVEKTLGDIHQDLQALVNQQMNMWTDRKNEMCLKDLFVVDPRINMKTIMQNKEELLADVYNWILRSDEFAGFTYWGNDASHFPECRLLWITGSAGTGKTMLIMGIINEFQRRFSSLTPRLSYFFCQATKNNLNNATNALRSLIWLLLFQQPDLIKHIQPDYDQMGHALFENEDAFNALDSIFEKMLGDPCLSPVYFIIDALDECDKGLTLLLRLISKSLTLSDKVKWLVSSRSEVLTQQDIQQEIHQLESPNISRVQVKLDSERLEDPVSVYIEHKLSALKALRGYSDEVLTSISTEVRQRANNIFLWVALVFKELSHVRGWDAVKTIQRMPRDLPGLYGRIMDKIEGLSDAPYCKNVLVAVSLAFRPLSFNELAAITHLPAGDDVPQIIAEECGSFLTITTETVSLIHQSAKDYLDENHKFRLQPGGVTQGHMDICERSIDAMTKALKKNIYGKDLDFKPNGMEVPNPDPLAHVRYACLFWVDHLSFSSHDGNHYNRIHSFLETHFLHWLEALSLTGNPYQCFRMVNKLAEIFSTSQSELYSLIHDAQRFILKNAFIIESAPLQLYSAAIVFSPQASKIRNLFQHNVSGINVLSGLDNDWGRNLQTINCKCRDVILSPNGNSLVVTIDSFIQVRNAMTGQVECTLKGHSSSISVAAISPDGSMLATVSNDHTIRIWNLTTGQAKTIIQGHKSFVRTIAFSPCGNFLASGTFNEVENLWLWNVTSGKLESRFKVSPDVWIVSYSPDGQKLVAGSKDGAVWMWDIPSGQGKCTERTDRDTFEPCLAISLDWSKFASAADEKIIQLWDVGTWKVKHMLKGHWDRVTVLVFSPGGQLLSGSRDGTIRVWDIAKGRAKRTLLVDGLITGIALSLDGSRFASYASSDAGNVRLWNTTTWKNEYKLSHGASVTSVAFSPNTQRLASASSFGESVCVWDITSGLADYAFEGHSSPSVVLAFSPDGSKLVSGSRDTTIRIWNVTTGQTEKILPHSQPVTAAAFSPDGSTLVSASDDTATLCIWNIVTGQIEHTITNHHPEEGGNGWVDMLFSSDGRKIALAIDNNSTRLSILTTEQLTVFTYGTRGPVAFSPGGEILASRGIGGAIILWNTTTGQDMGLDGHSSLVTALAYSPDGKRLASASADDKTIRIWEVATGRIEFTLNCADISTLLFAPDGIKLASGSNTTIRVWNLATRRAEHMFRGHRGSIGNTIFDLGSDTAGQIISNVGSLPFYSIDETLTWVTRDGTKVLYLPPQFRPSPPSFIQRSLVVVRGRTLAVENGTGRITIINFADDTQGN